MPNLKVTHPAAGNSEVVITTTVLFGSSTALTHYTARIDKEGKNISFFKTNLAELPYQNVQKMSENSKNTKRNRREVWISYPASKAVDNRNLINNSTPVVMGNQITAISQEKSATNGAIIQANIATMLVPSSMDIEVFNLSREVLTTLTKQVAIIKQQPESPARNQALKTAYDQYVAANAELEVQGHLVRSQVLNIKEDGMLLGKFPTHYATGSTTAPATDCSVQIAYTNFFSIVAQNVKEVDCNPLTGVPVEHTSKDNGVMYSHKVALINDGYGGCVPITVAMYNAGPTPNVDRAALFARPTDQSMIATGTLSTTSFVTNTKTSIAFIFNVGTYSMIPKSFNAVIDTNGEEDLEIYDTGVAASTESILFEVEEYLPQAKRESKQTPKPPVNNISTQQTDKEAEEMAKLAAQLDEALPM